MRVLCSDIQSQSLLFSTALSVSAETVTGSENAALTLSCTYTVHIYTHPVCWGRGSCTLSGCNDVILQTDGSRVTWRTSDRYQLLGNIPQGDVSLAITGVTEEDEGTYCCRVEIPGWFNDLKREVKVWIQERPAVAEVRRPIYHRDVKMEFTTMRHETFHTGHNISNILNLLPLNKTSFTSQTKNSPLSDYQVYRIAGYVTLILFFFLVMILYRFECIMRELNDNKRFPVYTFISNYICYRVNCKIIHSKMTTGSLRDTKRISTTICLYLLHLNALAVSAETVTGSVNDTLTLPCTYTVHIYTHPVCWGRGSCTLSGCNDVILQTDGSRVTWRTSDRYHLLGNISKGNLSLTISEVTEKDEGTYCCRVEISGLFNDLMREVIVWIQESETAKSHADITTQFTTMRQETFFTDLPVIPSLSVLVLSGTAHYFGTNISDVLTTLRLKTHSDTLQQSKDSQLPDDIVYMIGGVVALILLLFLFAMILCRWKIYKEKKTKTDSTMSVTNMDALEDAENQAIENIYI
ncbi:uncharacterized protein LOC142150842 [Mixophyes fleayi]|uniref:uncharacterized protein LOC142150842 n=1 Tax=Mixophyes fleayi TaxID=3061075 RepID=UPI003F4DA785